jgi:hypothetical protein
MLTTGLLLVAVMMGDAQSIETPAPVRRPGPSTPLAKRFATLFPVEGSAPVRPATPQWDFSPRKQLSNPRILHQDRQEIICGLTVVRQSADIDPGIIVSPNRDVVPAVRRIEPDTCGSPASGTLSPRR